MIAQRDEGKIQSNHEGKQPGNQMSAHEMNEDMGREEELGQGSEQDSDLLASKLSKELNNWRRRRTTGRTRNDDGPSSAFKTEAARTIKVRGHETLVVRKPKLSSKPPVATTDRSR
jgi:hypothetical protein